MEKLGNFLHLADYGVILGSLVICVLIGFYHRPGRGNKNNKMAEYFLGNREMSIFPIAISMLATTVSAVPLVSGVGEMYRFGLEYACTTVGVLIGSVIASYFIIPVFRYIEYVSIYEYLENRYDRSVRIGFSLCYIIMNMVASAVVLYVPALLVANVTGLPYWITASVSGVMCTAYCVFGGFKTVVWTDVVQFIFMMISLVVILWRGTYVAGGASYVWKAGLVEGFIYNIKWMEDGGKRFTITSSIIYGIFVAFQQYTTSQAVVQRVLSVKDIKAAQKSMILTIVSRVVFSTLLMAAAAVIYANFHLCDPIQRAKETGVKSTDLILLYFLQRFLSDLPGLSGLVFAGILSSALSTLSSYINSFAATTLEDFIKPYTPRIVKTEKREVLVSQLLTGIYGTLVLILSFIIPYMGGAIKAFISITGAVGGPLTGLMFLAFFFSRVNKKSCILALVCGVAFCTWLTFASSMYKVQFQTLPLSTEGCPLNSTSGFIFDNKTTLSWNTTADQSVTKQFMKEKDVFPLYKMSFVWYGPIGLVLTVLVGWWSSFLYSGDKKELDARLLSPLVTKTCQSCIPLSMHNSDEYTAMQLNEVYMPTTVNHPTDTAEEFVRTYDSRTISSNIYRRTISVI